MKDKFIQILSEEANEKERELFYAELEKDEEKKQEFITYLNLWKLASVNKAKMSWLRKQSLFEEFWKNKEKPPAFITSFKKVMRYAALFLLAALFGFMGKVIVERLSIDEQLVMRQYKLESNFGSISRFQLEDGSQIWLNSNSKVIITQLDDAWTAELEGEAYFDIVHDEDRLFKVDVGDFMIVDKGTGFNVSAYPEDNIIRTVLIEGTIDVRNKENDYLGTLKPNEGFIYNRERKTYLVEEVDGSFESAWRESKFVFIDKSLRHICDNLEKWYNVDIVIKNKELEETRFTFILERTTTIKQLLNIFQSTSDIEYRIQINENNKDVIQLK